ncbi:hypothetical protein BN2476_470056 [Paraburkholderia piptadeniae]|uniref:Uncharacterized protein n=1 Tax=Paraburkholderia piptadeniae TaxID=1701573 RepID=A0A1N7SE18_9BURK|nr:hypothetical protein BN2476_470056 [Paraburkholderia piptadeniae]
MACAFLCLLKLKDQAHRFRHNACVSAIDEFFFRVEKNSTAMGARRMSHFSQRRLRIHRFRRLFVSV